jgi:hypothetical protein
MISEIRVYYEGHSLLKSGFDAFFKELRTRALEKRCRFRLIASGSGATASHDFGTAVLANEDAWNILLIDSEGPPGDDPSGSLCQEKGWDKSHADSIFWMVEMMEAWFHADKDALEQFYGPGFRRGSLKANPKVEQISKKDLKDGLSAATKNSRKGDYYDNKTTHGPKLLASISADRVQTAAPNCQRLFRTVLAGLA